ncbi:hypothetical protein [Gimesia sp.]|uniref:hypothetical protein n=1 Tax=Gimesia sp. TaxID=2024833 RepID=UPI000C5E5245|nr:hypothetical protein [Gimesia sp.]MAX40123.1 hypothetical protein [Gimesia sp.]|tara:strand:+ start:5433 stop:5927 length:495 start_codon:yes stop_codon:yes gene_type:complete
MNSDFAGYWICRRILLLLVLLLGLIAGGYVLEPVVYAQNPQQADDAAGKSKPKMEMSCPMMMGLKGVALYADSPTLLMARAEELELNEAQKKQLEEIARSARKQAREILTAEQRDALKKLPEGRMSMMQIAKMQMKERKSGEDSRMMCPMCRKMMQEMDLETDH